MNVEAVAQLPATFGFPSTLTAAIQPTQPAACLFATPEQIQLALFQKSLVAQIADASMHHQMSVATDHIYDGLEETSSVIGHSYGTSAGLENGVVNRQSITLIVRLLMSGKEVGSIIGKRGENVKKYREESGARINISDGSSPERIVTITGTTEQIFTAFTMMSQKFEDDFTQGLLRMGDDGLSCPPVTLRLLVPTTQCGSIIGKGGCRIKDVRELTGASIQVASEALPTSTERTVTISGTAKAIAKCIRHMCDIFIESPARGPVIPYRPKPTLHGQQTILCPPNQHYTTGLLPPGLPVVGQATDLVAGESAGLTALSSAQNLFFTSCGRGASEAGGPTSLSPAISQGYVTAAFGLQPAPHHHHHHYIPLTASSAQGTCLKPALGTQNGAIVASSAQPTPVFATSAVGNGANPNATAALVADVLTDQTVQQLSCALNYPDFGHPSATLFPPVGLPNASQFRATNCYPGTLVHPLSGTFSLPEVAMNQAILGIYASMPPLALAPRQSHCSPAELGATNGSHNTVGNMNNSFVVTTSIKQGSYSDETQSTSGSTPTDEAKDVPSDLLAGSNGLGPALTNGYHHHHHHQPGGGLIDVNALSSLGGLASPVLHGVVTTQPANSTSILGIPGGASATVSVPAFSHIIAGAGCPVAPGSEEHVCKEIIISNELIGCIIGRGGTTVNEIRNISKAQVKISNCEEGAKDRKITLSGSSPSVKVAEFLINNSITRHQQTWLMRREMARVATALTMMGGEGSSVGREERSMGSPPVSAMTAENSASSQRIPGGSRDELIALKSCSSPDQRSFTLTPFPSHLGTTLCPTSEHHNQLTGSHAQLETVCQPKTEVYSPTITDGQNSQSNRVARNNHRQWNRVKIAPY